jgi:hypothetical protein
MGFSSIFVTFYVISNYRQRRMDKVYISTLILLVWNLVCYFVPFYLSVPNTTGGLNYPSPVVIDIAVGEVGNLTSSIVSDQPFMDHITPSTIIGQFVESVNASINANFSSANNQMGRGEL